MKPAHAAWGHRLQHPNDFTCCPPPPPLRLLACFERRRTDIDHLVAPNDCRAKIRVFSSVLAGSQGWNHRAPCEEQRVQAAHVFFTPHAPLGEQGIILMLLLIIACLYWATHSPHPSPVSKLEHPGIPPTTGLQPGRRGEPGCKDLSMCPSPITGAHGKWSQCPFYLSIPST